MARCAQFMLRAPCRAAAPLRLVSVATTPARPAHTTALAAPPSQAPRRSIALVPATQPHPLRAPAPRHTTQTRSFATNTTMEARNKAAVAEFDKLINDNKVMIFGRTSCPYVAPVATHALTYLLGTVFAPRSSSTDSRSLTSISRSTRWTTVSTSTTSSSRRPAAVPVRLRTAPLRMLTHSSSPQHLRQRHQHRRLRRYLACAVLAALTCAFQTLSRSTARASWSRCSSLRA